MPDIQFGQLQADLPSYENTGSIQVDNVIPLAVGYKLKTFFNYYIRNSQGDMAKEKDLVDIAKAIKTDFSTGNFNISDNNKSNLYFFINTAYLW